MNTRASWNPPEGAGLNVHLKLADKRGTGGSLDGAFAQLAMERSDPFGVYMSPD